MFVTLAIVDNEAERARREGQDTHLALEVPELLDELERAHQAAEECRRDERALAVLARRRGASYGMIARARGGGPASYHATWEYVRRANGGVVPEPDLREPAPDGIDRP